MYSKKTQIFLGRNPYIDLSQPFMTISNNINPNPIIFLRLSLWPRENRKNVLGIVKTVQTPYIFRNSA